MRPEIFNRYEVSTHSRPKAAGNRPAQAPHHPARFNSQPPEGGWIPIVLIERIHAVSTHSRPKAAGVRLRVVITIR